jgi:preprotein translocase subunit SecD
MAPRSKSGSRAWRPLTALAMIIVVLLLSIAGADTLHPGQWPERFKVGLGLDLSSGTELVLQAQTPAGHPPSSADMNQASSILLSRVNSTGTTGGQVQQQGGNLLNVSVPKASSEVIDLVSSTAQMRFRQVLLWAPAAGSSRPSPTTYYGDASLVNAATMKLFDKLTCAPGSNGNVSDAWKATVGYTPQQDQWDNVGSQVVSCDAQGGKYVLDKAVFKGTDVTSANAGLLPDSSQWAVNLTLDGPATHAFGALATNQYDRYYPNIRGSEDDAVLDQTAMTLDGDVVSSPLTEDALTSGQFAVSGPSTAPFTEAQADQLADQLKYGALPLSFKLLADNTISAQIGHASLVGGLTAGVIGLTLTVSYLFIYYRGLGLVSVSSLLIAALLACLALVLLSRYQDFTLSLSGIAGLVVAIGITADSFIVFFERLRDEVRDGKPLRPAVEHGWRRARRTILVSDTVSFLAAVVLYHFAVSDVQGFAYTLGLTTLIDVIVVFLFTKPVLTLLTGTRFYGGGHPWSGLDPQRLGRRAPWRSSAARQDLPIRPGSVHCHRRRGGRPPVLTDFAAEGRVRCRTTFLLSMPRASRTSRA